MQYVYINGVKMNGQTVINNEKKHCSSMGKMREVRGELSAGVELRNLKTKQNSNCTLIKLCIYQFIVSTFQSVTFFY